MEAIFSAILSPYLSSLSVPMAPRLEEVGIGLVKVAVQVHQKLTSLFLPSPNRYHYLFNLRHISGIFRHVINKRFSLGESLQMMMISLYTLQEVESVVQ